MCGIVGYIGKEPKDIKELLVNAKFNIHRGDSGVGIIYKKNKELRIHKLLRKIDEIYTTTLDKDNTSKVVRVGSFEMTAIDDEKYEKEQASFEKSMKQLLNTETKFAFLHHRKATYGADEIKNLHPMKYNDNYYIHNGTAGTSSVKGYLELHTKIEFDSETDTEVLAVVYNHLKEHFKGDEEKIYEQLSHWFPDGWGILIEITKSGKVTIIKDYTRDIWMYKLKDGGIMLCSEPTPYISKWKSLILVSDGINIVNSKMDGDDYTDMARKARRWWVKAINTGNQIDANHKCDVCKTENKFTLSTIYCDGHTFSGTRDDICFECMVLNDNIDDEDSENSIVAKKLIYSDYLG